MVSTNKRTFLDDAYFLNYQVQKADFTFALLRNTKINVQLIAEGVWINAIKRYNFSAGAEIEPPDPFCRYCEQETRLPPVR